MGEMADYDLERIGEDFPEDEEDAYRAPHKPLTCRHCGKRPLRWVVTEQGWRVAELNGALHDCPVFKHAHR